MTIGQRIASLRKTAGLSQEALAGLLGVSRQAIGKWETDASLPGIDNLQELARALNTSCDDLLTGSPAVAENAAEKKSTTPAADSVSLQAVKSLFAENEKLRHKQLLAAGISGGAVVCALALGLGIYAGQLSQLRSQLNNLAGRMGGIESSIDNRLSNLQSSIQQSLDEKASLVASWDVNHEHYDPKNDTVQVSASAVPRNRTPQTTAQFHFAMDNGQIVTVDAADTGAGFEAKAHLPLCSGYILNVSFTEGESTQTQQLTQEYDLSLRYRYELRFGRFPTPGGSWSTGSPDITYTWPQAFCDIWVQLPRNGENSIASWPVSGVLSMNIGEETLHTIDIDFESNLRYALDAPGTSSEVCITVEVPSLQHKLALPQGQQNAPENWIQGSYSLAVTDNFGRKVVYTVN